MIETVRKDILSVLKGVKASLENKDFASLKDLSDHTIHNSSIFQDKDSTDTAVLVYALYKILLRGAGAGVLTRVKTEISGAIEALDKKRHDTYRKKLQKMLSLITGVDKKLRKYAMEVIRQAQIRKGSKLYEHGISLAQSAEVMGISQYELMEYVGKTRIADIEESSSGVESRVRLARRLFS